MRAMHFRPLGGLLAFFILFATGDGLAQDAAGILQTALDKYEERVAGIDDYTVTYSVMGREVSSHLRKEIVDGHSVFVAVDEDEDASAQRDWDPYRVLPQFGARAEIVGRETIDGVQAHGLRVDDLEGLDIDVPAGVQGKFEPRTITLWIDIGEHYFLRRMDLEGTLVEDGEERPFEMSARMLDYRTVEGMPYPFRTAIEIKGVMGSGSASDEQAAEAGEQLAELERQMAEMPASQREMMEKMMGTQLEQLRKMVQSGNFEIELVVTDLKVNTGPPPGSGG